jgi:hypothetical protein
MPNYAQYKPYELKNAPFDSQKDMVEKLMTLNFASPNRWDLGQLSYIIFYTL